MVEFGNLKTTSVPCTILDVSSTGAGLEIVSALRPPDRFTLIWSDGLRKSCQVAWRRGKRLGVAFTDGPASTDEQAQLMTEEERAYKKEIGARLRQARQAFGYSQAEFAAKIDTAVGTISDAEEGETPIPLYRLMHIAQLLQVTPDWLITGKGRAPRGSVADMEESGAHAMG